MTSTFPQIDTHTCVYTYNSTSVYINIYKYVLRNFNMLNSKKHKGLEDNNLGGKSQTPLSVRFFADVADRFSGMSPSRLVYFGWSPFPGFQSPPGLLYLWFFLNRTGFLHQKQIYHTASKTTYWEGITNNIWRVSKRNIARTKSSRTWERGQAHGIFTYIWLILNDKLAGKKIPFVPWVSICHPQKLKISHQVTKSSTKLAWPVNTSESMGFQRIYGQISANLWANYSLGWWQSKILRGKITAGCGELARKKNQDFLSSFAGSQVIIKENDPMELVIIL